MHPFRRLAPLPLVTAVAVLGAGCGGSITDVTPRTAGPTVARAVTPFCDALDQSERAAEPVSRLQAGQRIADIERVADRVRAANQQVGALAPQELRGDVDLVTGVLDRQLRILEDSGGDTLALSRDQDLARVRTDPGYAAAARRVSDYVRRTC